MHLWIFFPQKIYTEKRLLSSKQSSQKCINYMYNPSTVDVRAPHHKLSNTAAL